MGDGLYDIYKAIQILMKEGIGSNPIIQLKKVIQISENVMIFFSFSFQVSYQLQIVGFLCKIKFKIKKVFI